MATNKAIALTGQAILGILSSECPPEFAGAQFELYQPSNFSSPMEEGISLYLYRVTINTSRRNLAKRTDAQGKTFRPSLPVDLFYMVTPWARTAARQQRLLGWAMRALEDMNTLPANTLNRYGEQGSFGPHEAVELICEPIALQDMINIWEVFKPHQQLSVTYIARMIMIDSEIELTEGPLVGARGVEAGEKG
ncbi:MAG: hypothetical protein A2X58_00425 [Nitrospirae bacterium GWC2_56_14]|nr:MAG: hypothetical protein A2X58_00425 [Nitrospirae bacterium GWC2_56_14]